MSDAVRSTGRSPMSGAVRIVFEEDGFPRELVTAADRATAVSTDAIGPTSLVTVYRDNEPPIVVEAGALPELRPLFGIEDNPQPVPTPPSPPPPPEKSAAAIVAFPLAQPSARSAIEPAPAPHPSPSPAALRRILPTDPAGELVNRSPVAWAMNPLFRYAVFQGRAPVREYAGYWVVWVIAMMVSASIGPTALTLAVLALVLPSLAVMVRRLHDLNISGWLVLVAIIPYVGALILVILLLVPARSLDPNTYGTSPLRA